MDEGQHFGFVEKDDSAIDFVAAQLPLIGPTEHRSRAHAELLSYGLGPAETANFRAVFHGPSGRSLCFHDGSFHHAEAFSRTRIY